MKKCRISFENTFQSPVDLNEGQALSEHLTVQNSPILFGCRIGICGTCAIEVTQGLENLHRRTENEIEFLEAMAPESPRYRLACQIHIDADITVKKVEI